jgi:hypothetical protein
VKLSYLKASPAFASSDQAFEFFGKPVVRELYEAGYGQSTSTEGAWRVVAVAIALVAAGEIPVDCTRILLPARLDGDAHNGACQPSVICQDYAQSTCG